MTWIFTGHSLQAQLLPASSNAVFYFAHLADGGPPTDRWTTVFRIVNPQTAANQPAVGTLWFFDPNGNPLSLDFGRGPVTSLPLTIAPKGAVQLETAGTSAVLRTGSVWAAFDTPVLAVEEFRNWRNGIFANGASVNASAGTSLFQTYADRSTGIAVSNPYASGTALYCSGQFLDGNGNSLGGNAFTIPGQGQVSFTLGNVLNLGGAIGSYMIDCNLQQNAASDSPPALFVALAIAGNSQGITSSMPPGDFALPSNPYRMIWNAFYSLVKALNNLPGAEVGQPQLKFYGDNVINAFYDPATNTVGIELGLVELLADSPSEVAWVIAHELGHAHQHLTGTYSFDPNPELDADQFSLIGLILTGYDAYASGGALGKLGMVSGRTSLVDQNFDNIQATLGIDPHTSFTNRIGLIMDAIQTVCSYPDIVSFCQLLHGIFHPHVPAPLRSPTEGVEQ